MAGTDRKRLRPVGAAPAVILVEPQLGENIGFAARAMMNCGLRELRLVRPRDGWPSEKARAAASGADAVIERARVFDTLESAVADLRRLYAASARPRDMRKPVLAARAAAREIRRAIADGLPTGVMFGPERMGLTNDHVALADKVVAVPLAPGFSSLNLAHAVLIVGYEWHLAGAAAGRPGPSGKPHRPATKKQLVSLFDHLERELDACGFLRVAAKRPIMVRNIRTMLARARLTDQEARTFHGMITELVKGRPR